MKTHYLVNPVAGKGKRAVEFIEKLKERCSGDCNSSIYVTRNIGDGEKYCREISSLPGEHRFVVCGGDGTVCEALNGIEGKSNSSIAIVPIGTGNDFVRNFCTNSGDEDLFFSVEAQDDGEDILVDYLSVEINGLAKKCAINMLNSGFDSEVADSVNCKRQNKLIPPRLAYISAIVSKFITKPTVKATVEIDGEALDNEQRIIMVIANGGYCGGGFFAAPRASLSDGLIDVCLIKNLSRMTLLRVISSYKSGEYLEKEKIAHLFTYRQCKTIKITFEKPQKVVFDGETEICESISVSLIPKGVMLTLPRGIDTSRFEKPKKEIFAFENKYLQI